MSITMDERMHPKFMYGIMFLIALVNAYMCECVIIYLYIHMCIRTQNNKRGEERQRERERKNKFAFKMFFGRRLFYSLVITIWLTLTTWTHSENCVLSHFRKNVWKELKQQQQPQQQQHQQKATKRIFNNIYRHSFDNVYTHTRTDTYVSFEKIMIQSVEEWMTWSRICKYIQMCL